jgi:hypothetical protein
MLINVYNWTNRYSPMLPANVICFMYLFTFIFENARKGTQGIECLKFDRYIQGTLCPGETSLQKSRGRIFTGTDHPKMLRQGTVGILYMGQECPPVI